MNTTRSETPLPTSLAPSSLAQLATGLSRVTPSVVASVSVVREHLGLIALLPDDPDDQALVDEMFARSAPQSGGGKRVLLRRPR